MIRKLIKQGENALTVTVPKEWTKSKSLHSGDELHVSFDGDCLVLRSKQLKEIKKTTIHLPNSKSNLHRFLLANAYRSGFTEIEIIFDELSQLFEIQDLIEELLGLEIIHQTKNSIILKTVALPEVKEYQNLFRRTFHIIQTGFAYLLEDFNSGKMNTVKFDKLEKNLLRLSNFCKRVILNNPMQNKINSYVEYNILTLNDYVISQLRYLHSSSLKSKKSVIFENYMKEIQKYFSEITEEIFKGKIENLKNILNKKLILFEMKNQVIKKAKGKELELIQDASILLRLLSMYSGSISLLVLQ